MLWVTAQVKNQENWTWYSMKGSGHDELVLLVLHHNLQHHLITSPGSAENQYLGDKEVGSRDDDWGAGEAVLEVLHASPNSSTNAARARSILVGLWGVGVRGGGDWTGMEEGEGEDRRWRRGEDGAPAGMSSTTVGPGRSRGWGRRWRRGVDGAPAGTPERRRLHPRDRKSVV